MFSNKITINFITLGPFMKSKIVGDLDSTDIFGIEWSTVKYWNLKFLKKSTKPNQFTTCGRR